MGIIKMMAAGAFSHVHGPHLSPMELLLENFGWIQRQLVVDTRYGPLSVLPRKTQWRGNPKLCQDQE